MNSSDREYRLQHSYRVANIGKIIAEKEGFDITEDINNYKYNFQGQMIDSPNDKYHVRITILKVDEESKEAYIMWSLVKKIYIEPNNFLISDKNTKIIYWNKVNSDDIGDNIIDIEWLDDSNIKIEDKVLNINYNKYDYRIE